MIIVTVSNLNDFEGNFSCFSIMAVRPRDTIEKIVLKKTKTSEGEVQLRYAKALDFLDEYLDLVELPPTDSGHYEQEFDTLVGKSARLL